MADLGVHLTDKRMKTLTKRLNEVYNQAYVESVENNKSAIEKLSQVKADINSGKYDNLNDDQKTAKINAYTLQVMRTENIVDDMSRRINNAGVTAQNIIRGEMNGIYALNRDYSNYSILKQSGIDYSFSQYDMNQIAVLVQEGESPFTKIAYEKMGKNSKIVKKLQNELIKATINGESQSQIMKRIKGITGQEGYNARRVAQTERTRVQTQARMMSMREAEAIGIGVDKQWVARMVRTRESHMNVHLQIVRSDEAFNNGLEFPGDPKGSAAEVINCHCYVKPMVKSVSPSLAAHRADYHAMSFEQYRESFKNEITTAQNDMNYYEKRIKKINDYLAKAKERGDPQAVKFHENALKVARANKASAQAHLKQAERNHENTIEKTQKGFTNPINSDIIKLGGGNIDTTGASGAIPRKDINRMTEHAKLYYAEIKNRTSDIESIANNTDLSVEDVKTIKNHIFFNKYNLGDDNPTSFDPDYDMAVSWQRLIEGRNIQEMDIVMLNHELMEYKLMSEQGLEYKEAHMITEKIYDYSKYIRELNKKEGLL